MQLRDLPHRLRYASPKGRSRLPLPARHPQRLISHPMRHDMMRVMLPGDDATAALHTAGQPSMQLCTGTDGDAP